MTSRVLASFGLLLAVSASGAAVAGCSDPVDDLTGSRRANAELTNDVDEDDESEGVAENPPNDDPALGGGEEVIEPDATPAEEGDAGVTSPGARVASPVPGKVVTYAYGVKNSRYAAGYHTGEDYAAPTGSKILAVRSGTIRWSNDNGGAYGKWMGLEADNGRTYVYCHLSARGAAVGTRVTAGQVIGSTGATGNVTGPHLHFEDHPAGRFVYGQVRKPSW